MRGIILAVVLVGVWGQAEAAVLCQKKNGTLAARGECKKNETQVDPAALGLQGPPGPKGDKGTPGAPGPSLVVKDDNEEFVGIVDFATSDVISVFRNIEGVPTQFSVNFSSKDFSQNTWGLSYESTDCSGPGLTEIAQFMFVRGRIVGTMLYTQPPSGTLTTLRSASIFPADPDTCDTTFGKSYVGVPPDKCCYVNAPPSQAVVAAPVTFDLSVFAFPLHLEVQQ